MKYFITLCLSLFVLTGFSQTKKQLSDKVQLETDVDINFMLDKHTLKNEKTDEMDGFRIQIIYNTDRAQVYDVKSKVYQEFRTFKTYLVFEQPYYKLRVGDFRTRIEATSYLGEILKHFPTAFIVKDVIKIKN